MDIMKQKVLNNVYWVGKIDAELKTFHGNDFSVNHGSSQNAYLIQEEKTVLIDTVWSPHDKEFVQNLEKEIDLHNIDYIVVNHGETDHSGALPELMAKIPDTPLYCTENAVKSLIGQFHHPEWNYRTVKTGDTLDLGSGKQLVFLEMKMLHWPDSMATYLTQDQILFSNDAFGQHFAVYQLFNDLADQNILYWEALKYYANILSPFSRLVLKKIAEINALNLPIAIIAPSHGAIWRKEPLQILSLYQKWAADYQEDEITIVYDTMYGSTKAIAMKLQEEIRNRSPQTVVKVFSISADDKNDIITEIFRSKAIAVGSPTIGCDIMSSVSGFLHFLKGLKLRGKKAAVFGTYGWSGEGNKVLREDLTKAGFNVIEEEVKGLWKPTAEVLEQAAVVSEKLCE